MQHAEIYKIIISAENQQMAILLRPQKGKPQKSYLLYDGSDHAFLYRNASDVILLDYLNPQILDSLRSADEIAIIEADWDTNNVLFHYSVKIKHQSYT